MKEICTWRLKEEMLDYGYIYERSCDDEWWTLVDFTLAEQDYIYCPKCGGKIVEPDNVGAYRMRLCNEDE